MLSKNTGFHQALAAPGRSREISEDADIYGWLIGSWELEVCYYAAVDLRDRDIRGEAHFGRVLEGRAIEDVWIMPRISERTKQMEKTNNMYGMTLRTCDPLIQAWRILWVNPVSGHREEQTGRKTGNDIVQTGVRADGTATRWIYTEIEHDSFHWLGEALEPDGKNWKLEGEFRARRLGPAGDVGGFHRALAAAGRSQEIAEVDDLYGEEVGN